MTTKTIEHPVTTIERACKDCAAIFAISPGEQDWFAARGYQLPKRCRECRGIARRPPPEANS